MWIVWVRTSISALIVLCCQPVASAQAIDTALAHQYFQEARAACTQDGGKLWGLSLCGPMLFVDARTRMVVANQSDPQGLLSKQGQAFVGRLPDRTPIANAYTSFAGLKWTMIVWSFLSNDKFQRVQLMMHESYHRIQNDLALPATGSANNHLDSPDGRIWLQLEWRALHRALLGQGAARRRAIEDALTFRRHRRSLFPPAEAAENAVEMNEGLASYTGIKLSANTGKELLDNLTKQLDQAPGRPSFVGSFAYVSGPAYGVLLDAANANWRKRLTPESDLGALLQRSSRISLATDLQAKAEIGASQYDGAALRLAESEREAKRQQRIADYRKRLVEGPVLLLPLTDRKRVSFNSTSLVPLDGAGTVYPTATVTDAWGTLEISNGALIINEGGRNTKVYVPAPASLHARPIQGDGWTLQLDAGWTIAAGERPGDFMLKKLE